MHNRIAAQLRDMSGGYMLRGVFTEAAEEIDRLEDRVHDLEKRIGDASILLADWDGYYDPEKKSGNAKELASLIEDAYKILQGKSWRDANG